jgi:hypothetical protein
MPSGNILRRKQVIEKQQRRHRVIRGKEGDKVINLQRYWKALFLTSILILIGLLLFPSTAMAKASKQLESLIKQRKWDKVSQIVNPGRDAALYHQVYTFRCFLNSRDNCIKRPNQTCYEATILRWKGVVKVLKNNRTVRWSKNFVPYLNAQKNTFVTEIKQALKGQQEEARIKREKVKKEARIKEEKEERERIKRQEEARIKREKEIEEKKREEEARIKKQEEDRIKREKAIEAQINREKKAFKMVNQTAMDLGYKKAVPIGVAEFLYNIIQGKDTLKNGFNVILWNELTPANSPLNDRNFKLIQILGNALIYQLSKFVDDEPVNFTIIIPKKQDKIYMEGQPLLDKYFTYTRNVTYQTLLGPKTAPVFKPVIIITDVFLRVKEIREQKEKMKALKKKETKDWRQILRESRKDVK